MKMTTIARPTRPAAIERLTESAPRLAPTSVEDSTFTLAGRAPELIWIARSRAEAWSKLPVMVAVPPAMGCRMLGLVSSFPPWEVGSATVDSTVCPVLGSMFDQLAMSAAVRSSKMAILRVGQVTPSPGQLLTASVVSLLNCDAPSLLKLRLTAYWGP